MQAWHGILVPKIQEYILRYELLSSMNFGNVTDRQTDRQTESNAYEPTVPNAQVGSKIRQYRILPIIGASPNKGAPLGWGPNICTRD